MDDSGVPLLEKLRRGGSARLITTDGLASIPADARDLPAGVAIDYYPFGSAFGL